MDYNKRFTEQTLDSDDYAKTETGAKVLKDIGAIGSVLAVFATVAVKRGPKLIENVAGLIKFL